METESSGGFHKAKVETHLALLREASEYFGIEKGRAPQYSQLLNEFYDQNKRTPQHLFAYSESCEITDIYSFWRGVIDEFPGLKEKVRQALSRGSVLRETEKIEASSNHARNLAFTYYLAGTLLSANLTVVVVDGIVRRGAPAYANPDIRFDWDGTIVDIECKRPQRESAVARNLKEARKKLTSQVASGVRGIVALDCSAFIRPQWNFLEQHSPEKGHDFISRKMETVITDPMVLKWNNRILGVLGYPRVPAMTRLYQSPILSAGGGPFSYFRRDSISSFIMVNNERSHDPEILRSVFASLKNFFSPK
jgi:hypothetical protein